MGVLEPFQAPRPIPLQVRSRRRAQPFAADLQQAINEQRYSDPRGNEILLRLMTGKVALPDATFTAKTFEVPGMRSRGNIDKVVVGTISDRPKGSEFVGVVSAPIRGRSLYLLAAWVVALAVLLTLLVLSVASTSPALTAIAPIAQLLAVVAPLVVTVWAVRRAQRANLLYDFDSLERFVRTIADDT